MKPLSVAVNKAQVEVKIWPDKVLGFKGVDLTKKQIQSKIFRDLAGAMIRSMYHYQGIGLAAPQAGVNNNVFVMDAHWNVTGKRKPEIFINPKIKKVGGKVISVDHPGEGCLSFPYGVRKCISRFDTVALEWTDIHGKKQKRTFKGMEAMVVQHEMDHLEGKLFIDHLSRPRRDLALNKARKVRRQYRKGMKRAESAMRNINRTPRGAIEQSKLFEAEKALGLREDDNENS